MLVKQIYSASDLRNEFIACGRDQFSYEGYQALIEYFDGYPEPVELDVIAICCDFSENTPEDIAEEYQNTIDMEYVKDENGEINAEMLIDELNYHTFAVPLSNGNILYQNF